MYKHILFLALAIIAGFFGSLLHSNGSVVSASSNVVTAREFQLVDEKGVPRGGIFFDESGNPAIYLANKNKEVEAYIALLNSGPMLVFRDHHGNKRLILDQDDSQGPSMGLIGKNGKSKIVHNLVRDKNPSLFFVGPEGNAQTAISVTDKGPLFSLIKKNKKPAILINARPNGHSVCTFYGADNRPRFLLGMAGNAPLISAFDADRSGLLFNVLSGARSQLALFSNGSPIWSATGEVPPAPELPPMDDMMRELTR